MKWHFNQKRLSDKTRDPIAGEFFASDAIKNAGEALVREGIQNSLDARIDRKSGVARVRILLSTDAAALPAGDMAEWGDGIWDHLSSAGNGLQPGAVTPIMPCSFLAFEDFGTTGLTGDPECFEPVEGTENPFFYFFRAEGKTQKAGDDRGRWGIGKQVFPRSSKAQMFFGYTETEVGGLLMGGCILKNHRVGETWFKPDGYFGDQKNIDGDEVTVPVTDAAALERFRKCFKLKRRAGETGLSVVVPWLEDNKDDSRAGLSFNRNMLALAVLDGYYVPILEGRLEVEIEDSAGTYRIASDTHGGVLDSLHAVVQDDKAKRTIHRLRQYISVATAARKGELKEFDLQPCPTEKASWREGMLSDAQVQEMRDALDQGETIGVTATLTVRPKQGDPVADSFRCLLRKTPYFIEKPCHVREDLIISNVDCTRVNGFACIIRIEDGPLARLLGDSEGPAHTEWQASSRNFKNKYTFGGLAISFVSEFANELVRRIYAASKALDRGILEDVFKSTHPAEGKKDDKSGRKSGGKDGPQPPDEPVVKAKKPAYRVSELAEGFVVSSTPDGSLSGKSLRVSAAYETTKGNAFKAHRPADFSFGSSPIKLKCEGCRVVEEKPNQLLICIDSDQFSMRATGFDVNRDLIVKAQPLQLPEEHDAEPTAEAEV